MKRLKFVRGVTGINDAFTGADGEITVDIDRWELRLHDGVTPGGHRILNLTQLMLMFMSKDSEFGEVAFAEGDLGYLVRIGDRQYALREIKATEGGGIIVTKGLATDGNTTIGIDPNWLGGQLTNLLASRINFALTTGTGAAYAVDVTGTNIFPQTVNGAIFGVEFHADASDGATMQLEGQAARPLLLPGESSNLSETVLAGVQALIMVVDNQYIIMGMQRAIHVPINPIEGLEAENVQEALEELYGLINEDEGPVSMLAGRYQFPSITFHSGALTERLTALAERSAFLFIQTVTSGSGSTDNPVTMSASMYIVVKLGGVAWAGVIAVKSPIFEAGDASLFSATSLYGLPVILTQANSIFGGPMAPFTSGAITPDATEYTSTP